MKASKNIVLSTTFASHFTASNLNSQALVNECIVGGMNGNVVAATQHKGNLYQMTFMVIYRANAANFMHSCVGGDLVKL